MTEKAEGASTVGGTAPSGEPEGAGASGDTVTTEDTVMTGRPVATGDPGALENTAGNAGGVADTIRPENITSGRRRIEVLDVLRGIAICGTLGTNIWLFADPEGPASVFTSAPGGGWERVLLAVTNGKLLALLTLLFGVGLEVQYRSARRRGLRWPGRYLWRATLLFVEGLLHYLLIFEWDVLMGYALTSILVAYLVGRSARVQWVWMAVHAAILGLIVAAGTAALLLAGDADEAAGTQEPLDLYRDGGWLEQVTFRIDNWPLFRIETVVIVPLGVTLFLAGIRLTRAGVFRDDDTGRRLRRRLMAYGFGIGVPLNAGAVAAGPDWFLVDRYVAPPIVSLGLLGLITSVFHRLSPRPGAVRRGLTSVGRTSLSCYVFQNLAASILCYGWGFGLAVHLQATRPWSVVALWAGIVLTFMVLSSLWLRRFDRGPLEIVWQRAYLLGARVQSAPSEVSSSRGGSPGGG